MHLLRTAPFITLTLACLAVPATSAAATTLPHHAQAAAATRIVIYKGNGKGDAGPPAGSLSPLKWKTDEAPETIVTNDGDLVDSPSLDKPWGACSTDCGIWWYKTGPNSVELNSFFWEKGGSKLEEHALQNLANNNDAWFTLANGTLSPRCLQFTSAAGQHVAFQLTKENGDWRETSTPCTTKP